MVPQDTHIPSSSFLNTLLSIPINIVKKLWQTISSIASSIFSSISRCCYPKEYFNLREITLLRDERSPHTIPLIPLIDRTITVKDPTSSLPSDEPQKNQEPEYKYFDDSLENLRAFTRDLAEMGIDIIYEKEIVNHLDKAETFAPTVPPVLKSAAKLLVEMGDKASKPLFKKFSEQKAQTIDPALQRIFRTLVKPDLNLLREKLSGFLNKNLAKHTLEEGVEASDYVNAVITWISTTEENRQPINKKLNPERFIQLLNEAQLYWNEQADAEKRQLYLSLEETLRNEFKDTKVPARQTIDYYVSQILHWLLETDHSHPLNSRFGVITDEKEELIDKIFERLITLLVEKKVDQYSNYLAKTMQQRLGEIIHKTMQKNAVRVADFFTERISELINKMSFTETVDTLIHKTIHQQIQAVALSEEKREEEEKLLKKAAIIAAIEPTDVVGIQAQIQAQNHLNTVKKHGGDEAYLEHTLLEAYSQHPACNPEIKQIIDQQMELIKQGKDPVAIIRVYETALYSNISEKLLELMMPTKKRLGSNGEIENIDPFTELWDRIYLPDEIYDLIKQSEDLTQEFGTSEVTALLETIKPAAIEIVKKAFIAIAKDKLKKQLSKHVQKAFEKITNPEMIDKLNVENGLPNLNKNLLEAFAKQELAFNLNEFAPLFHQLVTSEEAERDAHIEKLHQALIAKLKSKFKQFKPQEFYKMENKQGELTSGGLTDNEWKNITKHVVEGFEKDILQAKINQVNFNPKATNLDEVKDILKKATKSDFKGNNPNFGNLIMDVLFKLGKFNSEWLIDTFLKDKLSASTTESVEPWRKSPKKLIDTLTESLKETFSDRKELEALLSDEVKPTLHLKEKLDHQINVTARIAHDMIMATASAEGKIASYGAEWILTDKPDSLNQTITAIYKKIFGNRTINQSLVTNVWNEVFASLSTAADRLRSAETLKVQLAAEEHNRTV